MLRSALAVVVMIASASASAAAATKPQEPTGKLKPYPRPPPPLKLSDDEKKTLDAGKAVMRQTENGDGGGRGMAIFRVDAPPDIVWATINDFPSYPKWIDEVKKCA